MYNYSTARLPGYWPARVSKCFNSGTHTCRLLLTWRRAQSSSAARCWLHSFSMCHYPDPTTFPHTPHIMTQIRLLPPKPQSAVIQDQQPELDRYSNALSREQSQGSGTAGRGATSCGEAAVAVDSTAGRQQQEAGLGDGAGSSSLNRHNSHLTWSQRQQLRRTSAALRHATASRHVPPQESRRPPGHTPSPPPPPPPPLFLRLTVFWAVTNVKPQRASKQRKPL